MKCEDFGRYLDNYESLTDQEKTEMTDHAAMCEKCQAELDFFLAMLSTARSLPKIEPPADFMDTLNTRLDAEDKKTVPSRVVYHVRRSRKQYVTLAACFALVAVLTANRGILLDRIEGDEGGVITEDTVANSDNADPSGELAELVAPNDTTAEEAAPTQTEAPAKAVSEAPVTVAAAPSRSTQQRAQTRAYTPSSTGQTPSYNEVTKSEPTVTAAPASQTAHEEVQTEVIQPSQPEQTADGDYGIALRGAIQSEMAYMPYDLTVEEVSASLRANQVKENYELAGGEESIALGRYYSIDKDGKPIMTSDSSAPSAIGSLKISSSDAEKAMDVLNQYPHDEDGDYYTTGSENFSHILSDLNDEGVTYTDHTLSGSDDVKFKIEFN